MPDSSQQVIVEFIADTSGLQPAVEKLASLGTIDQATAAAFKQTNAAIAQRNTLLDDTVDSSQKVSTSATSQQAIYDKLTASVKNLSGASKDAVQNLLRLSTGDVAKAIQATGGSVDDFVKSLEMGSKGVNDFGSNTSGLRAQLRQVTNELAALTLAGQQETEIFTSLALKAGQLKTAMRETQTTVANLGSEVPVLKVFQAGVSGITGAFTAATGAAALFGDNNKDLQEVLVRVNAVMAINAGIAQVLNVVNDEAAISTARILVTQTLNNAQIAIENGLQSESVIIRGAATVAQYALNIAMALNPIGLIVAGLVAFVAVAALFISSATKAAVAQGELNGALSKTGDLLDAGIQGNNDAAKAQLAQLDLVSARQSESQALELRTLKANNKDKLDAIDQLNAQIEKHQGDTNKDVQELVKKAEDQRNKLESDAEDERFDIKAKGLALQKTLLVESLNDVASNLDAQLSLSVKNSTQQFSLQKQLATAKAAIDIQAAGDDTDKVFAIQSQLARDIKDVNIAQAAEQQKVVAAGLQSSIIQAQNASRAINDRASQEEIDKQKAAILEQAAFDITQEGLKETQKQAIRDKANQQALELQRNFDTQSTIEALQDQDALNKKELDQININAKDKLELEIQNISLEAAEEIAANRGKNDIIIGIEADRDEKIRQARLSSIEDTLNKEIALQAAQNVGTIAELEKTLSQQASLRNEKDYFSEKQFEQRLGIQKLDLNSQLAIIDKITNFQLDADNEKLLALEDELQQGLISQVDFNIKYEQLINDQTKAVADAEARKQALVKATADKAKEFQQQIIQFAIAQASKGVSILQTIFQQNSDAAQANIDAQTKAIQDLSAAGAITAKEAAARNKDVAVQQAKLNHQQAVQAKEIALFNAIIGTAQAVISALKYGPIAAAIVGAIGAAEIAVIASKQIPSFKTGKKDNYSGLGIWGEAGAELMEKDGKMYLASKPTISWLGARDKIYNPKETADMISGRVPVNSFPGSAKGQALAIDYDKMGAAIGKNKSEVHLNIDGYRDFIKSGQNFTTYLNNRRRWR